MSSIKNNMDIWVIIPAFNEEHSIAKVIAEIPKTVTEIIVVDNRSDDQETLNYLDYLNYEDMKKPNGNRSKV